MFTNNKESLERLLHGKVLTGKQEDITFVPKIHMWKLTAMVHVSNYRGW